MKMRPRHAVKLVSQSRSGHTVSRYLEADEQQRHVSQHHAVAVPRGQLLR